MEDDGQIERIQGSLDDWKDGWTGLSAHCTVLLCPQLTATGGQQPLRHISYHDGHEEDHSSQEGVADAHGHYEKMWHQRGWPGLR